MSHLTDGEFKKLRLEGHDPAKVHAVFAAVAPHRGRPTVILARTIKGYGLGEAGKGRNIIQQQEKPINGDELRAFRDFGPRLHAEASRDRCACCGS